MRETIASEITVDPELYSTTVFDFSGCTPFDNMFNAGSQGEYGENDAIGFSTYLA